MPKHQLDRRREELRDGVEAGNIDLVVFHDEIELLFDTLEDWGVEKTPQQTTAQLNRQVMNEGHLDW